MKAIRSFATAWRGRLAIATGGARALIGGALVLFTGAALAQPQCPPTSPAPVVQTVLVGETPAPLRIQLDVISTVPPPTNFFFFFVASDLGEFGSGGTKAGVPTTAVLIDASTNRWRYSGQIDVAPLNQPGEIIVEGDAPQCFLQPRGTPPGTVVYTINVVDQPPPPPPADPRITVIEGNGARIEPGRSVDLRVRVDDPPAGQASASYPLTFAIAAGDARFEANGGTTIAAATSGDGSATVRLRAGPTAGPVTIEITGAAGAPFPVASATAGLDVVLPPPRNFVLIAGNGQSGPAGAAGEPLVAALLEFTGFPAADVAVEWRTVEGPAVTLDQPGGRTAPNGRVQTGIRYAQQPGTSIIEARAATGETIRYSVTTTPGQGTGTFGVFSGADQTGALNSDADAPIVFALSEGGQPVVGETVNFRVAEGTATLATSSAITDADGRASVRFRYGASAGRIRIEATARDLVTNAFATAFTPDLRIVSGDGQSGRAGTRLPQDFVLEISQPRPAALEKGFAGVPVTWTVISGGGTLAAASNTTDADGRARNQLTLGASAGENRIRATLPGIGSVDFVATATPPATVRIAVASGDNQRGALNSDADQPVVFELSEDNRPVVGESVQLRVAQGAATLATPTAITDAQGRASVRFRYGNSAGPVRIEATARGATASATATAFAPNLRAASGNAQNGRIGTRLAQDLVLEIAQPALAAGAKGLAGVPVSWTIISGGGSLAAASGTTDAQGRASNQLTLGPAAGENRVRATLPGIGTLDFIATAVDPVPTGSVFEIVSGNGQSLPTAAPSAPLVVRLRTSAGVAVSGTTVAFTVSPAGAATLSNATATTGDNGQAQTIATLGLPGAVRITASLPDAGAGGPTLVFTLNGGVANTLAIDPLERSVAGAIDAACPALFQQSQQGSLPPGAADLLARCSELVGNAGARPDAVKGALRQMSSEESDAQNTASIGAARAQYENLSSRVSALRAGSTGISIDGLALAGGNGALPLSFLPTTQLMQSDGGAESEVGADFSRWGFFATGTIGQGELDDRGSSPGFDFDTYGLTAGVDYRFSDTFVAGLAVGYSDTDTDVNGGAGELATRGLSLSGYGTWYRGESFYVDGVATIGRNSYELSRRVLYTLGSTRIDQTALADPDGDQRSFAVSIGRDINRGALNFSPYLRAAWTRIEFDPYTERMSNPNAPGGGLALAVEGRTLRSFEGVLGAKASYTMSRDWGILIPHATIEILREFEDEPNTVVSRFVNDPTRTPFVVQGLAPDRDYFNLGIGLSGVFAGGRSAFIYLENRAGQRDYTQTTLAAGVRIEF